jgi:hypothetical protein
MWRRKYDEEDESRTISNDCRRLSSKEIEGRYVAKLD